MNIQGFQYSSFITSNTVVYNGINPVELLSPENTKNALEIIKNLPEKQLLEWKDEIGYTLLMRAFRDEASIEVINLLIERSSEDYLSVQDMACRSVLHWALVHKKLDVSNIKSLLEKMNSTQIGIQDNRGYTALMESIEKQCSNEIVRLLIEKSEQKHFDAKDMYSWSVLHFLITQEDTDMEILRLLLNKMSVDQIGLKDDRGYTALMHALSKMECDYVVYFLIEKSDQSHFDAVDEQEWSALHWAIMHSKLTVETFQLLVQKMSGEQVCKRTKAGETALLMLINTGQSSSEVIKVLYEKTMEGGKWCKTFCHPLVECLQKPMADTLWYMRLEYLIAAIEDLDAETTKIVLDYLIRRDCFQAYDSKNYSGPVENILKKCNSEFLFNNSFEYLTFFDNQVVYKTKSGIIETLLQRRISQLHDK